MVDRMAWDRQGTPTSSGSDNEGKGNRWAMSQQGHKEVPKESVPKGAEFDNKFDEFMTAEGSSLFHERKRAQGGLCYLSQKKQCSNDPRLCGGATHPACFTLILTAVLPEPLFPLTFLRRLRLSFR